MSSERMTRTQWRALIAAWLGWAFDGLDGYLYVMVAIPLVAGLVGKPVGDSGVALKAATVQAVFLVGWAIGGAVFGRIGDRLGRARTLTLTILTYAVFTGLTFFAQAWWHLLIFRFVAALGIGGEWAAGSALVSETLHTRHRAWASATLQSGYMVGCILAALTTSAMGSLEPRWVFLVGVAPALLTVWVRRAVPEPEEWRKAAAERAPAPLSALFSRELARTTVLIVSLTGIALTTVWAFLFFVPQAIRKMDAVAGWERARVNELVTSITIAFFLVNIAGNYFATYLARAVGHRRAFVLLFTASLASIMIGFRRPLYMESAWWAPCVTAFFALGLFGLFPLYVPPLFPTLLRTLGAGFTYNAGRLISAGGTMFAGVLSAYAGGPEAAIWWTGLLFIPGIFVAMAIPEIGRIERSAGEIT